ncbi:hypothetical protein [Streptosporangium canum]|uniref:hypothetical protein n=1 Tax=Streptosporangium canum TaxID=324952 RepID=UPI0037B67C0A
MKTERGRFKLLVGHPAEAIVSSSAPGERCVIDEIPGDVACIGQAAIVLLVGCAHEHMGDTPVCQLHAEEANSGQLLCPTCYKLDRHQCHLEVLAEMTDAGEQGVLRR